MYPLILEASLKRFLLLLIALIVVTFASQFLQRFAGEKRQEVVQTPEEPEVKVGKPPVELANQEDDVIPEADSAPAPQTSYEPGTQTDTNAIFPQELNSTLLANDFNDFSSEDILKRMEDLNIPTEVSDKGHPSTGLRKVIQASDKVRGLSFFEASFNIFEDENREELGFMRYVYDPDKANLKEIKAGLSREIGTEPETPNPGTSIWRLDGGVNLIVIDNFKGNREEEKGIMVSLEPEIH